MIFLFLRIFLKCNHGEGWVSKKIELTKKDSEYMDGKCTSEDGNERNISLRKIGDLPQ